MKIILSAAVFCLVAVAAYAEDATDAPDSTAPANLTAADQSAPPDDSVAADPQDGTDAPAPQDSAAPKSEDATAGQPPAADGGPAKTSEGVYRLGQVVVIGNPHIDAAGQTMTTVDQQEIDNKAARTLDEALQQQPGIDIRLRKEGVPRLDIRGLPPRHVPLFLNGVPINAASDGQFDPSLIPVENIAHIDVFRGSSSVLYGPGALGGVVDIVTKTGGAEPSAGLGAETGQGHERLVRGSVSGTEGAFDGFVSGSHFGVDGYPVADDGLRENSDKTRTNLFFNGGYTPNDQWQFGANFSVLTGSQGVPPSTISDPSNIFASNPKFERLDGIEGRSGEIDARYAPTGSIDFRATAYINQLNEDDNIYDDSNYNSMSNTRVKSQHVEINDSVIGGQFQSDFDFGEFGRATLGLIAKDESSNNKGEVRDVAAGGGNFNFRNVDAVDAIQTYSAAIQYVVTPLPRTHAVVGFAHHWFLQPQQETRDDDQLMASLSYDLLDDFRLNLASSRDVRFPSIQELFDPTQGNPNLTSEKAINVQGGFDWMLPDKSHVEVTAFHNNVDGFIQNDKTTNRFTNNNARFRGAEIAYRTVVLENLALRAAYSFLEATATQSNGFDGRLDLRPKHKVDFQATYDFLPEWQAYLDMTYLGGQVVSSRTLPIQQESLRNYAIVDAKISRSFLHDSLAVYLGVANLLDQQSDIGPGFPLEGRFVYGGIRTRI